MSLKATFWSCSEDVLVSPDFLTNYPDVCVTADVYELHPEAVKVFILFSSAGTKRVHNNIVYNEYISDREHVHMNSTQWETLTDFTKWLGREGKLM